MIPAEKILFTQHKKPKPSHIPLLRMLESMRLVSSALYLEIKMVEAARIVWAADLIKTLQLILFNGAAFGLFVARAKRR
ncbi:MAG: hypothetical protein LCH63_13540 [Candidatus Melainabacteria bacterium]|nr:hypothetical protein [Candidatus Melainabacteria bacterium]